MLSLEHHPTRLCDGISRRQWMRIGGLGIAGLGAGGLSLSELMQARAAAGPALQRGSFGRAKSCIVLFMLGGPPQHETWDPKPQAPLEVRGDLGTITTNTVGLHVGELMPMTAKLTEHIAVLRAMATDDNAHSSSGYWMLTGYPHTPKNSENATPGAPNDGPCAAAIVRHLRGDRGKLPGAIRLPEEIWNTGRILWPGQDAGWLGPDADPWLMHCDPSEPNFRLPTISLPDDVTSERLLSRRELQTDLNRRLDAMQASPAAQRLSSWQRRAVELLQTSATQSAFDLEQETPATRQRYGLNRFGQSVLLARRLVQAGVGLVQVNWTRWKTDDNAAPAWDTHANNTKRLKEALMPPMDQAYSALLEDLARTGLLDETLVVWMGEFGRSPKINANGGRDHWGHVFSAALAGGGIRGGVVHGQSDRQGAYPIDGRVEPQDLTATMFHCLGYAPDTVIRDRLQRPLAISKGQPIEAIL